MASKSLKWLRPHSLGTPIEGQVNPRGCEQQLVEGTSRLAPGNLSMASTENPDADPPITSRLNQTGCRSFNLRKPWPGQAALDSAQDVSILIPINSWYGAEMLKPFQQVEKEPGK